MTAPERIWAFSADDIAENEGGATIVAHESYQPYATEYVRADLAAVQPTQGVWNKCTFDLSGAGYDYVLKDGDARHGAYGEGQKVFWDGTTINAEGLYILSKPALDKRIAAVQPAQVHPNHRDEVIAVKVKPLVWCDYPNRAFANPEVAVAEALFSHKYQAQRDPWASTFMVFLHPTAPIGSSTLWWESKGHPTLNDAKTAAQDDYEARIMSAIAIQPDPRDEVIARLVEALRLMRSTYPYNPPCYGWVEQVEAHKTAKAALAAAKEVQHD